MLQVGCKKMDELQAINTAKAFHKYIGQENYKKAYELMVKKPTRKEIIRYYSDWTKSDGFLSFDEFKSRFGKFEKSVFEKRAKIKEIEVSTHKKNIKNIQFLLANKNYDFNLSIYVKKVDNSWKILNFSTPVP